MIIRRTRPLERLHTDIVRPIKPTTARKRYRYLLVVTNDFSRYISVRPLKEKNDARNTLIEIVNTLEKAINNQYLVAQIQADWGGEFRNKRLEEELK
jgi:transposase InsO family protein